MPCLAANENGRRPPLHARLWQYKLKPLEKLLLLAMEQHSKNGSGENIWPSVPRLAAYTGMHERTIQRLIHGWDQRGKHTAGLLERGILLERATANSGRHRSATYRINEETLEFNERLDRWKLRQESLPLVSQRHQVSHDGVAVSPALVSQRQGSGVTVSPDLKAFIDPKPLHDLSAQRRDKTAEREAVLERISRQVVEESNAEQMHFRAWQQIRDEGKATGLLAPYEACVKARGGWKGCHIWHDAVQEAYASNPALARLAGRSKETATLQQTMGRMADVKRMD